MPPSFYLGIPAVSILHGASWLLESPLFPFQLYLVILGRLVSLFCFMAFDRNMGMTILLGYVHFTETLGVISIFYLLWVLGVLLSSYCLDLPTIVF
jgi:hypothetical protein